MKAGTRSIASSGIGAVIFLLMFFFVFPGNILFSLISGGLGILAGFLIFREKPSKAFADGIGEADYEAALGDAKVKLDQIRTDAAKLPLGNGQRKVREVAEVIQRILDDLRQDPADFKKARQFLSYYLDATSKIVSRYTELSAKGTGSADIRDKLRQTEETLEVMREAYEKQLRILLDNDVFDLDTELSVIRRTIELEGLGRDFSETKPDTKTKETGS